MTGKKTVATAPLAAALLLGACASAAPGPGALSDGSEQDQAVVVDNHGWSDVRVYAVRHGARMRLGTVSAMNTARFELKPGMVDTRGYLQLLLRPIAGRALLLDAIPLWSGGVVHLDVQDLIELSSFAVYSGRSP